jgi:hypothetical protein
LIQSVSGFAFRPTNPAVQRCIFVDWRTRLKRKKRIRKTARQTEHPHMHQRAASGKAVKKESPRHATARRVLQHLLGIELAAIDEACALADFEGCNLPDGPALTPMEWRIRVKERVFACYGVDCHIDEPLSTLAARIELTERGVGCTLVH